MSAGTSRHPPYHLRPNKAIDRFLLVDLLRHVPYEERKRYEYIGLGGPFLEDFKIMHHYYPEVKLTSIEANPETYKRQRFNKSCKAIKLIESEIATYFGEHDDFRHPLIVWFDGTDFRQRTLTSLQSILLKLPVDSILKVTARVSFETEPRYKEFALATAHTVENLLSDIQGLSINQREDLSGRIRDVLINAAEEKDEMTLAMQQVSDYLPEGYEDLLGDQPSRAKLYFQILQNAISRSFPSVGEKVFHYISSNYYSDSTTMISITGMIVKRSRLSKVRQLFRDYKNQGDQLGEPTEINIPILSIKERMKLDPHLPIRKNVGRRLHNVLGYRIDSSDNLTEKQLSFYNSFHKYYPFFSKVQL
jgi:hypothetical protein